MHRHFMFLQGLPGPSFRMLATALRASGHRVSRINLNGGDWLDWRIGDAVNYRGTAEGWADWLRAYLQRKAVTDIVLFGELRPRHRAAIALATELSLPLFEFEEGYLRPNHVTVEKCVAGSKEGATVAANACVDDIMVEGSFTRRMRESVLYWVAATLMRPWFPHYRSHRIYPAWLEMLYWCRRRWRKSGEKLQSKAVVAHIDHRPFFLFPLQLDGDAQIVGRSTFASVAHALDHILESFAAHAPPGALLLVKRHPFDPDPADWATQVAELGGQYGISERVRYVSRYDLDPLLSRCRGVVTVNSTVGPLALARGKPVHVLGQAIYKRHGLVDLQPLDHYWRSPTPPEPDAFDRFVTELKQRSQVNGGFHDNAALHLLVKNALAVLLAEQPA
jgi:capsular polysaccharide export protein